MGAAIPTSGLSATTAYDLLGSDEDVSPTVAASAKMTNLHKPTTQEGGKSKEKTSKAAKPP